MSADRGAHTFGSRLREARERRGISLRQIATATKISVAALDALEHDDISRLPGGIFSRAFVRAYAIEVGLDPEATIHEFIAQFPNDTAVTAGHPTSDRVEDHQAVESERQTAGTFLWLAIVSVPLAAALVYFASSGRGAARGSATATAGDEPTSAPPRAPNRPVETPLPAAAPAAESPMPELPRPSAEPTPDTARTTGNDAAAGRADRLTIELSVRRPCWVTAMVDGQRAIERLLQPGERQTIDVRREMVLTAGDAAAVSMTLNGAAARPLGRPGEVVTARLNLTNYTSYLQIR